MNEDDRKELMDLIAEYGTAAIVEGSTGRIRQFKRIVKHVEAIEKAAEVQSLERAAKISETWPEWGPSFGQHDNEFAGQLTSQDIAKRIRAAAKADGEQK